MQVTWKAQRRRILRHELVSGLELSLLGTTLLFSSHEFGVSDSGRGALRRNTRILGGSRGRRDGAGT